MCAPARRLSRPWSPAAQRDVCVNRFTALRLAQLPSPLFIATVKASYTPPRPPLLTQHSLPKLLPHRRLICALRVRWETSRFPGDIPSVSAVRPCVLYRRREASEITVCRWESASACECVCVCRCVFLCKNKQWVAENDWPAVKHGASIPADRKQRQFPAFFFLLQNKSTSKPILEIMSTYIPSFTHMANTTVYKD